MYNNLDDIPDIPISVFAYDYGPKEEGAEIPESVNNWIQWCTAKDMNDIADALNKLRENVVYLRQTLEDSGRHPLINNPNINSNSTLSGWTEHAIKNYIKLPSNHPIVESVTASTSSLTTHGLSVKGVVDYVTNSIGSNKGVKLYPYDNTVNLGDNINGFTIKGIVDYVNTKIGGGSTPTVPTDVPIGTIVMYAGSTPPNDDWLLCNGNSFNANTYGELYELLGSNRLPDFNGRYPTQSDTVLSAITQQLPRPDMLTGTIPYDCYTPLRWFEGICSATYEPTDMLRSAFKDSKGWSDDSKAITSGNIAIIENIKPAWLGAMPGPWMDYMSSPSNKLEYVTVDHGRYCRTVESGSSRGDYIWYGDLRSYGNAEDPNGEGSEGKGPAKSEMEFCGHSTGARATNFVSYQKKVKIAPGFKPNATYKEPNAAVRPNSLSVNFIIKAK